MKLKEQLSTLADNIKTYWRRPPEGKNCLINAQPNRVDF